MANTHYNNIFNKKNVEFSIEEKSYNLPYKFESDVELKVNQILFNPVNEAFQKLLDNDLYNDALLRQYIEEGGAGSGPLTANSLEDVLASNTGDKYVVSSTAGLSVVHKGNSQVSKTVSRRLLSGCKVNRITFLNESFFAATDKGLYSSSDKTHWNKIVDYGVDFVDVCYNYNYLSDSKSYLSGYDWIAVGNKDGKIRFFGHNGSSNTWEDFADKSNLSNLNANGLDAVGLYSVESDPKMYLGTANSGLWSFVGYHGDTLSKESGTYRWTVNDLIKIDRKNKFESYLLATNYGVKQSKGVFGFVGVSKKALFDRYTIVHDAIDFENHTYIATSNGIFTENKQAVSGLEGKMCFALVSYYNDLYVGAEDGIYKIDETTATKKTGFSISSVFDLVSDDRYLIAQVGDNSLKLYDPDDFSNPQTVSFGNANINKIRQLIVSNGRTYIATDNGIYTIGDNVVSYDFRLKQDRFSDLKISFSKNINASEAIVQTEDNKIWLLHGTQATELSDNVPSGKITDAIRSRDDYYFISNGKIFAGSNDSGLAASNFSLINVTSDESIVNGVAFVSSDNCIYVSSDNGIDRIGNSSNYRDIAQKDNRFYGLNSNNEACLFGFKPEYGFNAVQSNLNVEDTVRTSFGREYVAGNFIQTKDSVDVKASNSSIYVGTSQLTGLTNLKAIDYIGYAEDPSTGKNLVLAAYQNETDILDGEDLHTVDSITSLTGVKCFADAYGFDNESNLSSGTNFILKSDGKVYKKDTEKLWYKDIDEVVSIENFAAISGTAYASNSVSGVFKLNKIEGNQSLQTGFSPNRLLNVDGSLIACGNNENAIVEYGDGGPVPSKYFPDSIVDFFLSNEIVEDEDHNQSAIGRGYNLSVQDFAAATFDEKKIESQAFLNKTSIVSISGAPVEVSAVSNFYRDPISGKLILEDIYGNGYEITAVSADEIRVDSIQNYIVDARKDGLLSAVLSATDRISIDYDIGNDSIEAKTFEKVPMSQKFATNCDFSGTKQIDVSPNSTASFDLTSFSINVPQQARDELSSYQSDAFLSSIHVAFSGNFFDRLSAFSINVLVSSYVVDTIVEDVGGVSSKVNVSKIFETGTNYNFSEYDLSNTVSLYADLDDAITNNVSSDSPFFISVWIDAASKDQPIANEEIDFAISSKFSILNGLSLTLPKVFQASPFFNSTPIEEEEGNEFYGLIDKEGSTWLGFDSDGLFSFDGFSTEDYQVEIGMAYIEKTDFSIDVVSTIICVDTETGEEYPYEVSFLSSYKNDSFNDAFYYRLDGSAELFVPTYPSSIRNKVLSNTDYDGFFKSSQSGSIRCLKEFAGKIYLGSDSGLLVSDKISFPSFSILPVNGATGSVVQLVADSNAIYGKTSQDKVFRIDRSGNISTISIAADLFESNGTVYCANAGSISAFNESGTLVEIESSNGNVPSSPNRYLGYFSSSDYYSSPWTVTTDGIRYQKLGYDFSTAYAEYIGTNLKDAKTIKIGDTWYLLVCNGTSIIAKNIENSNTTTIASGFASIMSFGYGESGMLIVLDGTTLYCTDKSINDNGGLRTFQLSDFLKTENAVPSGESIRFTQIEGLGNGSEIGISNTKHYLLKYSDVLTEKTQSTIQNAKYFLKNNNSNLYVVASGNVLQENGANEWADCFDQSRNFILSSIVANSDGFWTIYSSKPKKITYDSISSYQIIPNSVSVSGVFTLDNDVFYYGNTDGVYGLNVNTSYGLSSNPAFDSRNLDVHALEFFNGGKDYVYNFVETYLIPGYQSEIGEATGNSESGISTQIRVSGFNTSNQALSNAVNTEYVTTVGMRSIEKIGDYLFFSNGGDGYVYSLKKETGNAFDLDQLEGMNGRSSILMFCNGTGSNYVGYGNLIASISAFGKTMAFGNVADDLNILANSVRNGVNKIDALRSDEDFLVGSTSGLKYVYDKTMARSFYNRHGEVQNLNGNVKAIEKVSSSESEELYVVGMDNVLYEIAGLKTPKFYKILTLPADSNVLDIFAIQKNEYLIATTNGLYTTDGGYVAIDDLSRFTISGVYQIINEELAKVISKHVSKDHLSSSFISEINQKADNNLDFFSKEDKHEDKYYYKIANGVRVVENDMIDTIERGGDTSVGDTYVKVAFKNWATAAIETESFYSDNGFVSKFVDPTSGKTFDVSRVQYIVKNWKSGLKEIYIYVPSTATYYINNPAGMSNSLYTYNSISRVNVPNVSNVNSLPDCCTQLRVYLYNSHFRIKTILAAQCVGNSLPLKIYKDNVNEDDSWKGFFDTVVQPSALRTLPKTSDKDVNNVRVCTDDLDRIYLDFSIYGTDAQAIRIIAES